MRKKSVSDPETDVGNNPVYTISIEDGEPPPKYEEWINTIRILLMQPRSYDTENTL